ncbi:hypothetical protein HCN44_008806 [Aphidius gifuensis]|uniref:Uncharacterized protein n=1 Tax=Aphidius gifuensis TaxID=684658 RepID=A0A834XUI4_APHGI|nr:uncharacterized protein LOC122855448 [Aphidius gifuensis]KAF7991494.1 hypothetical protein HCN44_008806 [Aphidius gifuensis]
MKISDYQYQISLIRKYAKEINISEDETTQIFKNCFTKITNEKKPLKKLFIIFKIIKICFIIFLSLLSVGIILYNHPTIHNMVLRHLQNFIYPGFKLLRELSVPIIIKYPSLTELYDESCLWENPNFRVRGMDCWPCSITQSIPDMTGWNMTKSHSLAEPFTRYESNSYVDFSTLYSVYKSQEKMFITDARKVSSTSFIYNEINDVMENRLDRNPSEDNDIHISWRINRMKPSRALRKYFPKPPGTPEWWSQSSERYVFIDEPKASAYQLPIIECGNVILRCTSGSRLIKMIPSPDCQKNCKTFSIYLSAQETLWYNWWYWRPASYPANSTELTISYLTSYC